MLKKYIILLCFIIVPLTLSSCEDTKKSNISETVIDLKSNEAGINDLSNHTLSSTSEEIDANSNTNINISKKSKDVVGLMNDAGQPILIGRKLSGEDTVDVSLQSSAEMFVLMNQRFYGVKSNNPKELSSRIRAHPSFNSLVKEIQKEINSGSSCPLDPLCSYMAADISDKIADELEIDDLYTN